MHFLKTKNHTGWHAVGIAALLLVLTGCSSLAGQRYENGTVPVGIVGVQHMGPDFNVAVFYIDRSGGDNVSRSGGGGSTVCCGLLPRTWRPGMTAVVRWSVNDWKNDRGYGYIATVPIEKYDEPGDIFVHFFSGGKVRVISRNLSVLHPDYPIPYGPHDDPTATAGVPVEELFTKEELRQLKR